LPTALLYHKKPYLKDLKLLLLNIPGSIYIWTQLDGELGQDALSENGSNECLRRWLPKGRLVSAIPDAHDGCVTDIVCVNEDCIIATCGKDGLVVFWWVATKNAPCYHELGQTCGISQQDAQPYQERGQFAADDAPLCADIRFCPWHRGSSKHSLGSNQVMSFPNDPCSEERIDDALPMN